MRVRFRRAFVITHVRERVSRNRPRGWITRAQRQSLLRPGQRVFKAVLNHAENRHLRGRERGGRVVGNQIERLLERALGQLIVSGVGGFSALLQVGRTECGISRVILRVSFDASLETLDQVAGGSLLSAQMSRSRQTTYKQEKRQNLAIHVITPIARLLLA